MKAILESILHYLVEHPDDMELVQVTGEKTTVFELRCHKEDIGKVIGKSGKTISAIRSLLTVLAPRDSRVVFEVVK